MEKLKEYFLCVRPHSFPAGVAPVFVGSSFSLKYVENFNYLYFILFLLACVLIQSATNLFNEYYDYKRGLDKIDSQGISGSIVKGKLTEKEVFNGAIILYILSLFIGIYLTYFTSYKLLLIGLICLLMGYLYTGGKYPIAYSPFGEITAGFFMGTIIVAISFYLQTKYVNLDVILISLPLFILIGLILLANNIRDLENDKLSGRKTFAILVGKNNAIKTMAIFLIIVYILNIIFIFMKLTTLYILVTLLTIPLAIKIVRGFQKNNDKKTMAPYMVMTAKLTIMIGILSSIAYILEFIF